MQRNEHGAAAQSVDPGDPARLAHLALDDFLNRLVSDDGETWQYDAAADAAGAAAANAARATIGQRSPLIIDQFEEIVTAHPDRWPERSDFFRQLNQVQRDNRELWVLLTLREDYVASLDPCAPVVDGLQLEIVLSQSCSCLPQLRAGWQHLTHVID